MCIYLSACVTSEEAMDTRKLREARGRLSLLSLVLPPGANVSAMVRMLDQEYTTASAINSKKYRQAALDAITSAKQCLEKYATIPANGLQIFTGTDTAGEQYRVYFEPSERVDTSLYLIDNTFHVLFS